VPMPDITPDERRAMDAYEGAVVTCAEWVREHVRPGTEEWKYARGMLDCFVRFGIKLREELVSGTGIWADPSQGVGRVTMLLRVSRKLLSSAWGHAPSRDRPLLWPFLKTMRELEREQERARRAAPHWLAVQLAPRDQP
jgi:hypothetical protein